MNARLPARSMRAIVFFALIAATLAVAALVIRARTPDLVLEVVEIAPRELEVEADQETAITLFVRESDRRAEISIIGPRDRAVRWLGRGVALEADRRVTYRWDGRDDAGRLVREGRYRVRVRLPERGRKMTWPRRIVVSRGSTEAGREPR